jgi:translation initiation factor IF-1
MLTSMTLCSPISFGSEYAQVLRMLGNGRLEAQCFDGEKRLGE